MSWTARGRTIGSTVAQGVSPGAILLVGWIAFCVYAYPGLMSTDSVDQLLQARTGPLHDWYPPVMAELWRLTDRLIAGPFPMLAIQSVTFVVGLSALLARYLSPRAAALTAALILLSPPVITSMAVIWKDSQMAGFLLAGAAGLASEKRRWKLAGCGFLVLATAQRYNAPAATLPLVLGLWIWRPGAAGWRRYARALAVWIAITALAFAANRALTERKTYAWHNSIALFDIVGTIRFARPSDAVLRELLAGVPGTPTEAIAQRMRERYSTTLWWPLAHGDGAVVRPPETEAERAAVARAWRGAVRAYPTAYLWHRWVAWKTALGLTRAKPMAAVWSGFTENEAQLDMIGHRATHSAAQSRWHAAMASVEASLVFRAWAYLLIALALLPFARRHPVALALLTSGVIYELSLFVIAPSADFRYSHWMIACTLAGAALVFAARWRAGRARASEPRPERIDQHAAPRIADHD